ncbi:MAG: hypothetical protein WBG90_07880 [Saonia sp.]
MKLLIFRTDIKTKKKVKTIKPLFNNLSTITDWSIDLEDIDNVLRIETAEDLNEREIIHLLSTYGFQCEALTD